MASHKYKIAGGSIVGPGFDETEDADCQIALDGVTPQAQAAIVRLLNGAYTAGAVSVRYEFRRLLGLN